MAMGWECASVEPSAELGRANLAWRSSRAIIRVSRWKRFTDNYMQFEKKWNYKVSGKNNIVTFNFASIKGYIQCRVSEELELHLNNHFC